LLATEINNRKSKTSLSSSRHDIAERLRQLLACHGSSTAESAALLLGVDEVEVRISLDELAPYPTIGVLSAVVAHFGVDPTFLLTGVYDRDTHWLSLEGGSAAAKALLTRLMANKRFTPAAGSERDAERQVHDLN
jgi:hypothetical protein